MKLKTEEDFEKEKHCGSNKCKEMIDYRVFRYEELKEEINKRQKDGNNEGIDITSNPYGFHNAVLIG